MRIIDMAPAASGGERMIYIVLFFLVFAAFLILEIVRGLDDE